MNDRPPSPPAVPVVKRPTSRPVPTRVTRPIHVQPRDPVSGRVTR